LSEPTASVVGRVAELWRYPVKSLVGERLAESAVDARGLAGDRLWSVRDPDGKFGSGKTTRRFRRMDGLLELASVYDGDVPVIAFPDGRRLRGDEAAPALSEHVGRPVTLGRETDVSHFDEGPMHLLTTASIAAVGGGAVPRRFRMNVLVDTGEAASGLAEDAWIGYRVAIGDEVVVAIRDGMPRCLMVDLPQIGLGRGAGLLRRIVELNDTNLGVVADVERGGTVREGDAVRLLG
jgi:uncharacterized protein YcbX